MLYKLSLSLELLPLYFKFVQQSRTLSLFLLYFTGGPFELSTQECNVAFIIVVLILFLVDLLETSDQFIGLIISERFLLFGRFLLSVLELIDFGFKFVFFLTKLLFFLIPHMLDFLELLLLFLENELPLKTLGLV